MNGILCSRLGSCGDDIPEMGSGELDGVVHFEARVGEMTVLSGGKARYDA